jgi:hypothetical protein
MEPCPGEEIAVPMLVVGLMLMPEDGDAERRHFDFRFSIADFRLKKVGLCLRSKIETNEEARTLTYKSPLQIENPN